MKNIKKSLIIFPILCKKYLKNIIFLFSIYLLAFSSLIRANYAYADDIGRTYAGYHGWLDWSRWSTEILATLVHAEWHLTDISPFPQILACFIMAIAGIILLIVFKDEKEIDIWNILAVSITALAPYFLGIISYKFDSPYMALSFLASVVPFLMRNASPKIYFAISIFSLLIMCTTYQAYSGVYPMIAFFLTVQDIKNGKDYKECLKFLTVSALSYLISLCLFWLFLMRDNGLSVSSLPFLFPNAIIRYINYYAIVYSDFTSIWKILILIIFILFVYLFCRTSKIKKGFAIMMAIVTILINSFLCFGAYLFVSREAYDTRAMNGFNIFLALIIVFISFETEKNIPKLLYSALIWCFFVFALTYGNALAREQDYIDYRVQLMVNDLNSLDILQTQKMKSFYVEGKIGMAPVNTNMAETYPLLKRTIYNCFNEGDWGRYYICNYINIPNITAGSNEDKDTDLPVLKDTVFHTITGNEANIIVIFK